MKNLYEVLGVSKQADAETIKRAYRKLAHQYHPDKNPGDKASEEAFKEVTHAYEVLSDETRRRRYDRFGAAGLGAGFGAASATNVSDMFGDMFGDIFGRRSKHGKRRGKDRTFELTVDFAVAINGGERVIDVPRNRRCQGCSGTGAKPGTAPQLCHACGGSGAIKVEQGFFAVSKRCSYCKGRGRIIAEPCADCGGVGNVEKLTKLRVRIPAGASDGTVLRYAGEGEPGEAGGAPGDLKVVITVIPHPFFERQGDDVTCELPVTMTQACLGGNVEVPTLEGQVTMRLPPGTQNGKVFRLRGQGLRRLSGQGRGDQHVTIVVETPQALADRQRQALELLQSLEGDENYPRRTEYWRRLREAPTA